MLHSLLFAVALVPAQAGSAEPPAPPALPASGLLDLDPFRLVAAEDAPDKAPEPIQILAPLLPPPAPPAPPAAPAAPAPTPPDRWALMKELQGTWPGACLDGNRTSLYGWVEASYNFSTVGNSNLPVTWNDLANDFMLQQTWVRLERTVVTSGTTEPTFGYRIDALYGTDYRYTLPRGLWNGQLAAADGVHQNNYGADLVEFYGEAYIPTIMQGLDVKVGRFYVPFGTESIEAVSTPLWSRSYAFTWAPPFTQVGVLTTATVNPKWTVQAAVVDGNDIVFDDGQEARFTGTVKYTQPGGRNVVTFGTTLGRGKFVTGAPNPEATFGTANEPAGRNNLNVFDLVWLHTFNPVLSYNLEVIYGYQSNVPANVPGGIIKENATEGTAHWGSVAQYLFYTINPRLSAAARFELFDDFEGQRTGFEGLYTSATADLIIKLRKDVIVRPELRYDYNGYSKPFEGNHGILVGGADVILRW